MGMMKCLKHGPHALGKAVDAMNRACCPECLREEKYYAAKRVGEPLPCVGYEHTLDWRHLAEIEKLEELLKSQYQFQKRRERFGGGEDAVMVLPGRFTEPLTIVIYYVVLVEEQDYLLTVIDKSFLESTCQQRRIQFYKAERWHEEVRGDSYSYQFLEGLLLREVVIA